MVERFTLGIMLVRKITLNSIGLPGAGPLLKYDDWAQVPGMTTLVIFRDHEVP